MPRSLIKLLASFFTIGYFPFAAGSLASILGGLICLFTQQWLILYFTLLLLITLIGFAVSAKMEEITKEKDPSCIVIDEVAGAMLAFFMLPLTPAVLITTFFLFRAIDMFKIYPANKFELKPRGVGVMMDDLIAGVYANLTMQIAVRLSGIV